MGHPCAKNAMHLDNRSLFDLIKKGHVRQKPMANVDPSGRDLAKHLLQPCQERRLTALEALRYDWLRPPSAPGSPVAAATRRGLQASLQAHVSPGRDEESSDDDAFKLAMVPECSCDLDHIAARMRNFSRLSKFERAVLTLAAHNAAEREVMDLKETFVELDTGGDG